MRESARAVLGGGKGNTTPHVAWLNNKIFTPGRGGTKKGWKGPYLTFLSCGTADSILSSVNVWKKWITSVPLLLWHLFLYSHNVLTGALELWIDALSQFCRSLLLISGQQLCKFLGTKACFYVRKEFNSRRIFPVHQHGSHFTVLYTNVAAVTSCENNLYSKAMKPQTSSGPVSTLDIEAGFTLQCANKVVSNSLGASGFCYQASEFCS